MTKKTAVTKPIYFFTYVAYLLSFGILLYSAITESWIRFFVGLFFFIITVMFNFGILEYERTLKEKK